MNTRHLIIFGMAATVTMVAQGELLDGGWRISVGASYNAPAKVRLNFSPARFNGGNVLPTASGVTLEQARRQAGGRTVNGKTYYDYDGSGRHISSVSAVDQHTDAVGGGDGSPEAGTWNAHVYKGNTTIQGDSFTLASVEYGYVEQHDDGGRLKLRDTDEAATPGVLVELSRNLYHNKDYNFGVDLAFAVNFFFGRDIFKTSSRAYQNAGVYKSGKVESTISPVAGRMDEDKWYQDAEYYGGGEYDGIGTVFHTPQMHVLPNADQYYGSGSRLSARGDYWDLEMTLALRPYYDVFEWLRIYGTFGAAVSRAEFDLDVTGVRDGVRTNYERDYSSWDVYGIGGLGMLLRWHDFCLGFDFLARFWDRDLQIEDDIVRGSLQRGRWMFRGMIGYEF